MNTKQTNILWFDIEVSPILGYAWQTYDTSLLKVEKDSGLLAFAFKINNNPIHVYSLREYTERQMVIRLWKLFNDADIIVAQNGDKFDIRWANRLFLKYKLKPPAPYKTVDTLKIAKKYFRFTSNRLDFIANMLLGEGKIETNLNLWMECVKGNKEALKEMEHYCVHDVKLLHGVYERLRAWHISHPNLNLTNGTTHNCPACGGKTQKRGFMITRVGKYQRYACITEGCGAWSKGEKLPTAKVIS